MVPDPVSRFGFRARAVARFFMTPSVIARAAAATCFAGGAAALIGVLADRPVLASLGVSAPALHPLASVLFMIFGACLALATLTDPPRRRLHAFALAVELVCVIALVAQLLGYALPFSPGPEATGAFPVGYDPGLTNFAMTFAFGCAALAAILLHWPSPRTRRWMIVPLLPVFWVSYLSLTANFYRVEHIKGFFLHTLIPLHAAALFAFLLAGFLAIQPRDGFMAALNRRYLGGMVARIAFPVILVTPFTVGWIRIKALRSGDYDLATAFSQFATTNIVIFGAFIWFCAHMLNRIDARRENTMESLRSANAELQRVNAALEAKIEEQARTEEARQKTELQLFQSQKMEAMGTLATGIAHDFNNLLTVMLLNVEAARDAAPDHPELQASLTEIRNSGHRATEVIRQIMAFGRKTPGVRVPLALDAVMNEATDMLRHALPPQVQITAVAAPRLPLVQADAVQVQQVLLNLGTNAAHAMAEAGGTLEITARHAVLSAAQARLSPGLNEGDYVTISVADTGHGMDDETRKRVFDPFFTTKPPGKGTGLGLSVAHGIMRLHGGAITVYSEPGRGTSFTLYFPACESTARTPQPQVTPPDTVPRGAGELILCVDDDPALLAAMGRRLERSGYRAVCYADPRAALEDFRTRPDDFALALTDYSMPDLSGRELAAELLRLRPGLPVILMSGFLGPDEVEAVKAAGVRHVALKPDVIGELDIVVPRLLAGLPVPGPGAA